MRSKTLTGGIPENITYFYSDKKKLQSFWENDALHAGWVGQEVIPAYCSDSANSKTMESGATWASGRWGDKKTVQEKHSKNDPITGIRIVSLEIRGEGGRAYKVVTPDNFYFDVREDVLMDTMLEVGISPNGVLNGSFIWARVGAEMKLIRVGSVLHKLMIATTEDGKMKKISFGDLEVGGIYQGKNGEPYVFIGYVDCDKFTYERSHTYNSSAITMFRKSVDNGILVYKYNEVDKFNKIYSFRAEIKNSHAFIKKIGNINVPSNFFDLLRGEMIHHLNEDINRYKTNYYSKNDRDANALYSFASYGDRITVRPTGTNFVLPPDLKALADKFPSK